MPLQIALSDAPRVRERLQVWKRQPVTFVREVFGVEPDAWQAEVLEAFPSSRRLAMVACANPGKTAVEAWIGWNFLLTRHDAQAKATAISGANLKTNLWKELAYWHAQSPLLQGFFTVGAKRIANVDRPNTWFMDAATWDRDADTEQQGKVLAGLHAQHVLFLLDEAGGIPDAVALTAENALAGGDDTEAHVVLGGNPLSLSGPLYRAAVEQPHLWTVFSVTGDPDDPKRAPRVSLQWAREQIEAFGRDSAYVQVYVLGKFPTAATDALVSLDMFEAAFARWEHRDQLAQTPRSLGADIARHGKDRTVVFPRAGDLVHVPELDGRPTFWQGQDTMQSSKRIEEIAEVWAGGVEAARRMPIYVDDIGLGGGVEDRLLEDGFNAIGVNVARAAIGWAPNGEPADTVYADLKSQLCTDIQARFRAGTIAIDPRVRRLTTLVAEATTLKVAYRTGRKKVEGKDDYKRRTGKSTDFWDGMMNCFADVCTPSTDWVIG